MCFMEHAVNFFSGKPCSRNLFREHGGNPCVQRVGWVGNRSLWLVHIRTAPHKGVMFGRSREVEVGGGR